MTDDLYKPQVSLGKIGKRYYWTVYRRARDDERSRDHEPGYQHGDVKS